MPEIDTQIWMAIRARISQAAGALPIHWPAETFSPPATATGLLPFIAVGDTMQTVRALIGSRAKHERSGIVTMVYVAPLGYTQEWYIERAAGLLEYFRPDGVTRFQSVCLHWGNGTAVPRVERGYRDDGYFRTPVLIPWRCAA